MASRSVHAVKSLGRELVQVFGGFAPNGTSAPTGLEAQGVASLTRTGVGTYLITLQDKYPALVTAQGSCQLSSAADTVVQFGDYTPASKTLVFRILTAGAAADVSANANNKIFFTLTFRNSSIK